MLPDFRLVSADSHVVEPPDLWLKRIERRYLDRAPRIVSEADSDYFICAGALNEKFGFMTATSPEARSEDLTMSGRWEGVMRGAYDPSARLKDMDRDDVEAELLYCSLSLPMFAIADLDFQSACFRAYNDWLAEFCAGAPERLFGVAMIPVSPVERGIAEMQRCAKLGFRGAMISVNQDEGEGYEHPKYDPLWSAAEDLRMPISLHVEAGKHRPSYGGNMLVDTALVFTATMYSVVAMIFSGVFDRHPGLRVVSVENDASWAVAILERIDYRYERDRSWTGSQYAGITSGRSPSQIFHDVACTFMRDVTLVRNRDCVGVKNLIWGSDYPHFDSTWPHSKQTLSKHFVAVSQDDQLRIARLNAIDLYDLPLTV